MAFRFSRRAISHAASQRRFTAAPQSTPTSPQEIPALKSTLLGSLAGSLSSLVGLGGGFVLTPALTSIFILKTGLTQHQAQATTLASIVFSSVAASGSYLLAKAESSSSSTSSSVLTPKVMSLLEDAAMISFSGILFSPLGVRFGRRFDSNQLKRLMGAFMCVGPTVPMRTYLERDFDSKPAPLPGGADADAPSVIPRAAKILAVGVLSGFSAGLFGIGGGAITVPCLAFIGGPETPNSPPSYTYTDVLTTSLLAMSLPAIIASYAQRKLIIWKLSGFLSTGSAVGGSATARFIETLPPDSKEAMEDRLRYLFAGLMMVLGGRFAFK